MKAEKAATSEVNEKCMPREEISPKDGAVDGGDMEDMVSLQAAKMQGHSLGAEGPDRRAVGGNQGRRRGVPTARVITRGRKNGDVGAAVHQEVPMSGEILDGESERCRRGRRRRRRGEAVNGEGVSAGSY